MMKKNNQKIEVISQMMYEIEFKMIQPIFLVPLKMILQSVAEIFVGSQYATTIERCRRADTIEIVFFSARWREHYLEWARNPPDGQCRKVK